MYKVKTWLNAHEFPKQGEVNNKPSETVPDQTMTIREILDRYARGLSYDQGKVPLYDGEEDILDGINWQTLDLSEQMEFRQRVREELQELQNARLQAEAAAARPENLNPASKQSAPAAAEVLNVNPDGSTTPIS